MMAPLMVAPLMVAPLTVAPPMVAPLMVAPLMVVAPRSARAKACHHPPLNSRWFRRGPAFTPFRRRPAFTPLRCHPTFTPVRRPPAFTPHGRGPAFTALRRRIGRNLDGRIRLARRRDPWHLRVAAKRRGLRRIMRVLWVAAATPPALTAVLPARGAAGA